MLLSILNAGLNDSVRAATDQGLEPVPQRPAESPEAIAAEVASIRAAIEAAHGTRIRFVISTGVDPLGPIKGGPLSYTLNSADPEKLKTIVDDMQHRAHEPIAKLLPATLVIGENFATEKLKGVFTKFGIDSASNFISVDEDRAILYRLALANKDLKQWLETGDVSEAPQLAAFFKAQSEQGRDKLTLLLPEAWSHAAFWTRRAFNTLHVVTGEKPNLHNYGKDRVFLMVQRKGEKHPEAAAFKALRNARYPIATLTFNATAPLSRYMRFIEATAEPHTPEIIEVDGPPDPAAWKQLTTSPESPKSLAGAINAAVRSNAITCGEIAFFGELTPPIRKALDNAVRLLFRSPFKMPGAVLEAPAEMLIDRAGTFSILILSVAQARFALAAYEPDRHIAQFLATKLALERKHRPVRAILVKDLSIESLGVLEEFFSVTAANLSSNGQIQTR